MTFTHGSLAQFGNRHRKEAGKRCLNRPRQVKDKFICFDFNLRGWRIAGEVAHSRLDTFLKSSRVAIDKDIFLANDLMYICPNIV